MRNFLHCFSCSMIFTFQWSQASVRWFMKKWWMRLVVSSTSIRFGWELLPWSLPSMRSIFTRFCLIKLSIRFSWSNSCCTSFLIHSSRIRHPKWRKNHDLPIGPCIRLINNDNYFRTNILLIFFINLLLFYLTYIPFLQLIDKKCKW